MSRNRTFIIAAVVVLFIAAGVVVAARGIGGGGGQASVDLKVTGATMSPGNPTVSHNDTVTMTVTADRDEEIHLHGYDISFDCKAGKPLTKTFKADKTGEFEIEIESSSKELGKLTVRP